MAVPGAHRKPSRHCFRGTRPCRHCCVDLAAHGGASYYFQECFIGIVSALLCPAEGKRLEDSAFLQKFVTARRKTIGLGPRLSVPGDRNKLTAQPALNEFRVKAAALPQINCLFLLRGARWV
ncbi:hypothetical protein NDU88_007025 [Pleurodeles waltl]|uniref:Uncharacterized protein n=1 Tax=Pleurodeles waltl TaxID=8319 RepID=A0AAV7LS49_PLEWA|nr:hypothetical protein NDU88_007025 [Pleurodeles waltl]